MAGKGGKSDRKAAVAKAGKRAGQPKPIPANPENAARRAAGEKQFLSSDVPKNGQYDPTRKQLVRYVKPSKENNDAAS
jgi:hypothetical protein